ncbi:hypothetical protein EMA8858_03826 [Emticicia aquatica]|uniref:Uncharacterized protein n=1 Tax=Emticicia aquatica TaxID=1681835 RepID=A0ABN8EX91_9BACT|nr:hypothetical protein [Emticicia aquatica]CAH0997692.1 hypothetical protein EMA8858_03826 [Emticicia aquatica]
MKNLQILFILVFISHLSHGQQKIFNDSTNITTYISLKNDVIVNACDSLFILNAKTYKIYETALTNIKKKASIDNEIMKYYSESLQLTMKRIDAQNSEYKELKNLTNHLISDSQTFVNTTQKQLTDVNTILSDSKSMLTAVNKNLDNVIAEIKNSKKERWKLLGNGVLAGISISSLVFIIVK